MICNMARKGNAGTVKIKGASIESGVKVTLYYLNENGEPTTRTSSSSFEVTALKNSFFLVVATTTLIDAYDSVAYPLYNENGTALFFANTDRSFYAWTTD